MTLDAFPPRRVIKESALRFFLLFTSAPLYILLEYKRVFKE